MTIEVYPSLFPCDPIESHEYSGGTIAQWFESKGLDYRARQAQPVVVLKNGHSVSADAWESTPVEADDEIQIRVLPHGGLLSAINRQAKRERKWAIGWLLPKKPKAPQSAEEGRRLNATESTANEAKLGAVVPELLGRFRRFPDYLTPPRKYFVNAREQWTEFLCCIGVGQYQITDTEVKVGDTPMLSMGADAEFQIYEPGADVSGSSAHEHWHTVNLVGGTAGGKAGLELLSAFSSEVNPTASSYSFLSNTITGSSAFPAGWQTGTFFSVAIRREYEVTLDTDPVVGSGDVNLFEGNFRELQLAEGDRVVVVGAGLDAEFEVRALELDSDGEGWVALTADPDGTPAPEDGATLGTQAIAFRKVGRTYRITGVSSATLTVAAYDNGLLEPSWPGFAVETVAAADALFEANPDTVFGGWSSLIRGTPGGEQTTTSELDFFFSNGLGRVKDDGTLEGVTVQVEVQYRDAAVGGPFTSVVYTYSAATMDQLGYTERITHSMMAPEFRVRRVGAVDASTSVNDDVVWYGLKTRLPTRTSYPNWTTMRVKIRGGGRTSAEAGGQINVVATRRLPVLQSNGAWSGPTATRSIISAAKYIATSIGYTDSDLDIDEFRRLHAVWTARGDTFDHVFGETTVKAALDTVFSAGMAEFSVEDGRIRPVRDEPRTVFEKGYSPQNMTRPLRRAFRSPRPDDPDGIEVEYTDGQTWAKETVRCMLPGDAGAKLTKMSVVGVTDRTRAWRIGMRRRREQRYRQWEYSFATELDALNSRYMSYVPLLADAPGYGQSSILVSITDAGGGLARLRVSEPLTWAQGESHVVAYRAKDGSIVGPFAAQPGGSEFEVLAPIPQPWPAITLTHEPPHVYFGTVSRWSFPALITSISPQGMTVAVTATNYDARVYADDDNSPT